MRAFLVALALVGLLGPGLAASAAAVQVQDETGSGVSKTTYSGNDPIPGLDFLLEYLPVEEADDSCDGNVCDCTVDGETYQVQQGRAALSTSSTGLGVSSGFGMHLVNCSCNPYTGGMTTAEVEAEFTAKLGDMSSYDSFMDYNVALYTSSLDSYISAFDADSVNYLAVTWTDQGTPYYGIMFQVPNSQMVIELMSENSTLLHSRPTHRLEQRASSSALARAKAKATASGDILTSLSIGRAASDMDAIDEFYSNGMQTTTTLDIDEGGVQKRCYLFEDLGSMTDICFTKRPDNATSTDFKVSDFETMLNTVHADIIAGDNCNNKWVDNHYAMDYTGTSNVDYIAEYIADNAYYYYCNSEGLHYMVDPTGWGIQLDIEFTSSASPCSSSPGPPPGRRGGKLGEGQMCPCTDMVSCGIGGTA